jgi:hypothetical protein
MIIDALLNFDNNSTINVVGGTQPSANVIDLHIINGGLPVLSNNQGARDIGIGDDPAMKLLVLVTTAFSGGTSMSVTLQGATDNGSGAPNAFSTWYASPVYTTAQLVAGARLMDMDFPRPPAAIAIPRFIRLLYTTVGAATGVVWSTIVLDRDDQSYQGTGNQNYGGYPAGITVAN